MEGFYEKHAMVSARYFIMLIVCYGHYLASKMYFLLGFPNNKLVELFLGIEIAIDIDILMRKNTFFFFSRMQENDAMVLVTRLSAGRRAKGSEFVNLQSIVLTHFSFSQE